jgi:hypothetical protein
LILAELERLQSRDSIATAHINRVTPQLRRLAAFLGLPPADHIDERFIIESAIGRMKIAQSEVQIAITSCTRKAVQLMIGVAIIALGAGLGVGALIGS